MRYSTLFWIVLAAFCGSALFHTSQQVTAGREKLAQMEKDIGNEAESLRVLQAEWSYLNQPDRLEKLAREYLSLEPMTGRQFAQLADIPLRSGSPEQGSRPEMPVVARVVKPALVPAQTASAAAPVSRPSGKKPSATVKKTASAQYPKVSHSPVMPVTERPPSSASKRDFGDVMKSLGVD